MGLIREPLDVDFTFIDKPPTEDELREISEFIKKQKEARSKKTSIRKPRSTRSKKTA